MRETLRWTIPQEIAVRCRSLASTRRTKMRHEITGSAKCSVTLLEHYQLDLATDIRARRADFKTMAREPSLIIPVNEDCRCCPDFPLCFVFGAFFLVLHMRERGASRVLIRNYSVLETNTRTTWWLAWQPPHIESPHLNRSQVLIS